MFCGIDPPVTDAAYYCIAPSASHAHHCIAPRVTVPCSCYSGPAGSILFSSYSSRRSASLIEVQQNRFCNKPRLLLYHHFLQAAPTTVSLLPAGHSRYCIASPCRARPTASFIELQFQKERSSNSCHAESIRQLQFQKERFSNRISA